MLAGKQITIVVAMGRNGGIGLNGRLPWHLPRELQHFKATTIGKPVVMGRRTCESIGRALPGRQNLVITRNPAFCLAGCECVRSFSEAVERSAGSEVMVIGGGQLYREALPFADRMILTVVECEPPADTWFPDWDPSEWTESAVRVERADEQNPYDYRVIELTRRRAADDRGREPERAGDPPV